MHCNITLYFQRLTLFNKRHIIMFKYFMTKSIRRIDTDITEVDQLSNLDSFDLRLFVKKLVSDTILYIPAKIIPGALGVIGVAIFTRMFKPDAYGQYILVITTTTILTAIASQWLLQSILRYRAQYLLSNQISKFNQYVTLLLIMVTSTILLLSMALYPLYNLISEYRQYFIVALLIIISGVWFNNLITVLQADLRSLPFSLITILNGIFKFALPLILILVFQKTVINLLWGNVFAFVLALLPIIFVYNYHPGKMQKATGQDNKLDSISFLYFAKQFFRYGFPMIGWFLGAELLSITDRYLIQLLRNSNEVGIYSSNYNLVASAMALIAMPLLTAAHPLLMKAGTTVSNQKERVQNLITLFSRYFLILAFPIILYVIIFSKEFANLFLGAEYRQGSAIIPIALISIFIWYFAMFGHKGLEYREKTNIMFLYVMICTIAKIILNLIFIPKYGYIAAAFTTLVCFTIYPILVYVGTRTDIKWLIPWRSIMKIFLASLFTVIFLVPLKFLSIYFLWKLVIAGIVLLPIYGFSLYLVSEFKAYELDYISNIFKGAVHGSKNKY